MKTLIKRIIGQSAWDYSISIIKYLRDNAFYLLSRAKKTSVNSGWEKTVFSVPKCHSFFGYYDIQQLNKQEDKLLAHIVRRNAKTFQDDVTIGYFEIGSKEFHPVASSMAWCWQQGSRLRWHPLKGDCIVFNDVVGQKYVTKVVNTNSGKIEAVIPMALYDFDSKFSFGLSLNFSRLQRLRPGYGYNRLPDQTIGIGAPVDDGIYYVDLKKNTNYLLISLKDLASECDPNNEYEHYINHISISPNGKSFMFFHIYNLHNGGWKTRLCVYNMGRRRFKVLEEKDNVSHYDWRNDEEILVTCYTPEKKRYYALYQIGTGKKTIIRNKCLEKDGHPTFLKDSNEFITDTYPLLHNMQFLFKYNIKKNKQFPIASFYSSSRTYGEKRCDMHPRLSDSQRMISIDSSFSNSLRKIVLLRRIK